MSLSTILNVKIYNFQTNKLHYNYICNLKKINNKHSKCLLNNIYLFKTSANTIIVTF